MAARSGDQRPRGFDPDGRRPQPRLLELCGPRARVRDRDRPPQRSQPRAWPPPHDGSPALLAVAHGSRDPRHAAALRALMDAVREARPGLDVELGFLDLCGPDVPSALAALDARGARRVAAVPLFLTSGYHVRHDIPAALAAAGRGLRRPLRITVTAPLGPDPLLLEALEHRVREAGLWPGDPDAALVLASAGSSDPDARAQVERTARRWARSGWGAVRCAYASAAAPSPADAVAALRADGWRQIVLASYFLAPGRLPDRVLAAAAAGSGQPGGAAPGVVVTEPLTSPDRPPAAELVRLLLARHAATGAALSGGAVSAA